MGAKFIVLIEQYKLRDMLLLENNPFQAGIVSQHYILDAFPTAAHPKVRLLFLTYCDFVLMSFDRFSYITGRGDGRTGGWGGPGKNRRGD